MFHSGYYYAINDEYNTEFLISYCAETAAATYAADREDHEFEQWIKAIKTSLQESASWLTEEYVESAGWWFLDGKVYRAYWLVVPINDIFNEVMQEYVARFDNDDFVYETVDRVLEEFCSSRNLIYSFENGSAWAMCQND